VDPHAYRGKVVLRDFWATWCSSCQLEMPRFVAWQTQYGTRGLQIIGISMEDDPGIGTKGIRNTEIELPHSDGR
jgi:thiol-disulfide isomerase/thioredoxin